MAWLALPLIFLLPGYLTLAAWRENGQLDFWEGLFLVPFTSILLSSWIGFVLAEVGAFSLATLSLLLALYCLALSLLARRRLRLACLTPPGLTWVSFLLVAVLAVSGWAFSRPAEVISGTFDPGIYLSTGANIARTGAIAFNDPFVARLGEDLRPFLLERRGEIGVGAVRLPAFWMPQAGGDTVIPAFFHLYPVWLAILYSIGGVQASLLVSPVFGLLGVWALFILGRRLASPGVGLLASGLLALNPAQVWFARYPLSEATVQMFLLGGLALWVLMQERRSHLLALLGGTAFGLAHLVKVDQVFLPAALFLSLFLIWLLEPTVRGPVPRSVPVGNDDTAQSIVRYPVTQPHPSGGQAPALRFTGYPTINSGVSGGLCRFFLVPYGLLLAHSILHVYFFSFAYTWITIGPFLRTLVSPLASALYLCGALALGAAVLARGQMDTLKGWVAAHRRPLTLVPAGIVGLAALYGYFVWPLHPEPNQAAFLSSDGVTPVYLNMFREEGLVRLGWYLSPLGLLLGLAGLIWFAARRAGGRSWPLLILFASQLVFYLLTAGLAYPVHFWAIRRYLPLVIPAFLLFAAFVLASLWPRPRTGEPPARPYTMEDTYPGLEARLHTMADRLAIDSRTRYGRGEPVARPSAPLPYEPAGRLHGLGHRVFGPEASTYLRYLAVIALAAALLVYSVQTSSKFLWQTEYQGALDGLQRWAGQMENPALVLFKPRTEGNIFSAPLQNLFGKTAFVLQQEPDEMFYTRGIERWLGEGWAVYLALGDRYPRYLSGNLTYALVDGAGLEVNAMEQSTDRLPRETLPMSFPLRLYRLQPASGYPYVLNMGPLWTENALVLQIPPSSASGLSFQFRAWTGGPLTVPVSFLLDGRLQQSLLIEREPRSYQITMPVDGPSGNGRHEISLVIDPSARAETRGIVLEWVEVVEMGPT